MSARALLDAAKHGDPTGTGSLRKAFRSASELHLRQLRAMLRRAVVDGDVLGLAHNEMFLGPSHRLMMFGGWLNMAAATTLDAEHWVKPWLDKAASSGLAQARVELGDDAQTPPPEVLSHLLTLANMEVTGIEQSLVQKLTRIAHAAVIAKLRPIQAFRRMAEIIDKDTLLRLHAFCNVLVVKTHVCSKLECYRENGIARVGTIPEHKPAIRRSSSPLPTASRLASSAPDHKASDHFRPSQNTRDADEPGHPFRGNQYTGGIGGYGAQQEPKWTPRPRPGSEGAPRHPTSTIVFPEFKPLPLKSLNGVAFKEWRPPENFNWNRVGGQADLGESPLPAHIQGKRLASGLIIREPDGRVWLARPWRSYGYVEHTFPKGTVEPHLSMQANAIKETFEETGLKARITGLYGDVHGHTTVTRYYTAVRESGDPSKSGWESDAVALVPVAKLDRFLNRERDLEIAADLEDQPREMYLQRLVAKPALDMSALKKIGAQKGSNPGGTYEDAHGQKYYIKQAKSPEHLKNELAAARLYALAGTPTLTYRDVKGGQFIATEITQLDKDNVKQFDADERAAAQREFAVHAWLANWDAVGTGGDNLGTAGGQVLELDMGGALAFRAQGAPKGAKFGNSVSEWDSMRDSSVNPDAGKLFGAMTQSQLEDSALRVGNIPDDAIREAAQDQALADKLIARKNDIIGRAGLLSSSAGHEPPKPQQAGGDLWDLWHNAKSDDYVGYAQAIDQRVKQIAAAAGVDPKMVSATNKSGAHLGGILLGAMDPESKTLVIYARHLAPDKFAGVTAHEVNHLVFQRLRAAVKANEQPITDQVNQFWNVPTLRKEDGVSDYSKQWWGRVEKSGGTHWIRSAVYETVAEMARIKLETGKLPGGPNMQGLYHLAEAYWKAQQNKQ